MHPQPKKNTFLPVIANADLRPWPPNSTRIELRRIKMPNI